MNSHCHPIGVDVRKRRADRARAATLIELLVVIALIGLLVAILIPSLQRSMRMASATLCKSNLRELGHGLYLYRIENDGWLPSVARRDVEIEAIREQEPWFVKLYPAYLADPLILTCPEDPFRYRMARAGDLHRDDVSDLASYGINSFIMTAARGGLAEVDRRRPARPLDTILVADLGPDDAAGPQVSTSGTIGPFRNACLLAWDDGYDPFLGVRTRPWLTTRHEKGINMLTLDGGAREARTLELMRRPVARYYPECAAGGCTFCNDLRLVHYSFARDHLFWWTGPAPIDR